MDSFTPLAVSAFKPEFDVRVGEQTGDWFFSFPDDPEVIVKGEGPHPRQDSVDQANLVLVNLDQLKTRAIGLLEDFMKDKGTWYLSTVDCGKKAERLECQFVLSFVFEAERDPYEYGYTYFDVCFIVSERAHPTDQNGRPIKFVVGFH